MRIIENNNRKALGGTARRRPPLFISLMGALLLGLSPIQQGAAQVSGPHPDDAAAKHHGALAPVNGIYTEAATKDLGEVTGISAWKGTKFRGWLEGYYVYNFNRVDRAVANANQGASVIKSRDPTVEGRTFDVRHNSFTLNLAEIEIEKVPQPGGVGFKFDYAQGTRRTSSSIRSRP